MGKKLTEQQREDRIVKKILQRIKNIEKDWDISLIHRACYRYVQANLQTRKALKEMKEAKQKFEEAKAKLAK